jgi:ATP-binding cassette subfamily C protein
MSSSPRLTPVAPTAAALSPAESIAWLKQRLGSGCEEVLVQGDRPLLLDDPSCAYVTLTEHHQLFCVGYERGAPRGRREHLALCQPGQLLFGLEPGEGRQGTVLMLSGVTGSVVWRIPSALLLRLAEQESGRAVVARLFDAWIELLARTLPPSPMPAIGRSLRAGQTADLEAAVPVRSESGVVWIALSAAPRSYQGSEVIGKSGAQRWPLGEQAWAVAQAASVRVESTADLIAAMRDTSFADEFHTYVVALASQRRADLAARRLARDATSRDAERALVDESLRQLAAAGRGDRLASEAARGDDFERACGAIFTWLGLATQKLSNSSGLAPAQVQAALARMTTARARPIRLADRWYEDDAGPILAFVADAEGAARPVALTPGRRGYDMFDPRVNAARRLTPREAERLLPEAYQFHRPLPDRPLSPLDVLRYSVRHASRDLWLAIGIGAATGSLGTLIPLLTGHVFDRIIPGAERGLLGELTLLLLSLYVGLSLFDLARGLALVRGQTQMDVTMEAGVWDRLLKLPLPFFRKYSAGDLAARAAGIGAIRQILAGVTLSVLLNGIFALWNLGLLFYIEARLALAAGALVLVATVAAGVATLFALQRQRRVADLDGQISGLLLQLLSGIAKLRVTGSENRAFGVWSRLFARRRDAELGGERINVRIAVFHSFYPVLCSAALFWLVAGGAGKLTTGQFLAFNVSFAIFLGAMLDLVAAGLQSLSVVPMYERAKPILAQPVESAGGGEAVTELEGRIELSHVSFRYAPDAPPVLDDIDLRIEPREFVAIVGPSGSGKSTLLRILLGFESCSEGGVFYDGQALSGLDVRAVRQQIGVVLQHSGLMAGDIFTNIVGTSGRGVDDAWRAAQLAAVAEDIALMPMGMHTQLAQGGGTLSGGQRQRLLIARALASQPRILLFDEATSALDNQTQAMVAASLEALRVTRVVIAHRLSTIRHADRIIVLDRGRVVQIGRFDELLECEGLFRDLARRQMM